MADVLKKLKALYNPVNRAARKDKRAKKLEDKAEDIAYKHSGSYDTYHSIDDGAVDEKIKAKLDKASSLKKRAAELRKKSDDKDWTDEALHGEGGYKLKDEKSPIPYTAPVDSFAVVEEEDSAPLAYRMNGAKFKEMSPNLAFSSKDFHLVQKLQNNYKMPSEGSFKTNAQNVYSSFDTPLEYRGMNPAYQRDSGPTRGKYALAGADRIAQQNKQGLSNALAIAGFGMDAVKTGIELAQKKEGDGQ